MPVPDKIARRGSYANHEQEFPESIQKLRERDPLAFDLATVRQQLLTARHAFRHVSEILGERHPYDPDGCADCDDLKSEMMIAEAQ